jgi:hypothetical protein
MYILDIHRHLVLFYVDWSLENISFILVSRKFVFLLLLLLLSISLSKGLEIWKLILRSKLKKSFHQSFS